jgi:hypothetical protein
MGRYDDALAHYKRMRFLKDTLYNSEKHDELAGREANYLFEKKEAEAKLQHEKELLAAEAKKKRQTILVWSALAGLSLVVFFSFLLYKRYKLVKSQKILIQQQKELVEEKQKEIVDSITYAKRIQQSLLPNEKVVQKNLIRLKSS